MASGMSQEAFADKCGLDRTYIRMASGMSQEAFADKCGLDRTYISGIERGVRNPTLEVINVIASGLQIELKDLFDFDAEKKS